MNTPANSRLPTEPDGQQVRDDREQRLIDHWFPCAAVDEAVKTSNGSGLSEKALFTWFASRPIAQARAAVLTALLPPDDTHREDVEAAVRGDDSALRRIATVIARENSTRPPVILDMFSGRGIIPLEAARIGATAVGIDLSPVATLGGRLLAEYTFRDWSNEPPLPFGEARTRRPGDGVQAAAPGPGGRLLRDVRAVLDEVGRRVQATVESHYPRNPDGRFPWAYLWAVTIPCDLCRRRFPLIGSLVLRRPYKRTNDHGQALRVLRQDDIWHTEVIDGGADQKPTFAARAGRKGKSAICLFCGHVHTLDTIKAKGEARQYQDALLAVADTGDTPRKLFRAPRLDEVKAASMVNMSCLTPFGSLTAIPTEVIPAGNEDTVRASGYGYRTYGELMNCRQTLQFVATVSAIREVHADLLTSGLSHGYAAALSTYAVSNLQRRLRYATRGVGVRAMGNAEGTRQNRNKVEDLFSDQTKLSFQFDYLETGQGAGPGTWPSVARSSLNALKKVLKENSRGQPGHFRRASATALPYRDGSIDAVITDPPYYRMIDYADTSDLFHVWFQRALFDIEPDLFGSPGLQDKSDEIIIKRGAAPGEHRTAAFYQLMLARAFDEAWRVLRPDGHLVVVFGHSDPEAWLRLLGALHEAKFVVTSTWPSRTETANTGVASIKVTVTIACRVAKRDRPIATVAHVNREIIETVQRRVRSWDRDGLALADQLMAAYGPAMEVYGRYSRILGPDGSAPGMDHYVKTALRAVREATALRVDDLPLERFDATTRFAVFWLRVYGLDVVSKGEARFIAQVEELRFDDLRGRVLTENKAGFKLCLDKVHRPGPGSSTFEVARALAAAWREGGTEPCAQVLQQSGEDLSTAHLSAVIKEITARLPRSDAVSKALSAIIRNASAINSSADQMQTTRHMA